MPTRDEYLAMAHRQLMRSSLWRFTSEMFMHVYKRPYIFADHHRRICDALDSVVRGDSRRLMINIPPRYGKTELVSRMFTAYGLALNPAARFISLSYSADLVEGNSEAVKRVVGSQLFERLFGTTVDRERKNTTHEWYTTAGGGLYVAPFHGQITGFGAGLMDSSEDLMDEKAFDAFTPEGAPGKFSGALVIDDPLKPADATSDRVREGVNRLFETTIRNRVNSRRTPIIIIMQRLHENDLCGYLLGKEGRVEDGGLWTVITASALTQDADGNEHALWPHMHTVEELHRLWEADPVVFETQYQQDPRPHEDMVYTLFQEYDTFPEGRYIVKNYTDPAGRGKDDTVSVDYREYPETGECYIVSVVCSGKGVEYTVPEIARMLTRDGVQVCKIEGNGLGDPFAALVRDAVRRMGNGTTRIDVFPQTGNKESRILNNASRVQNLIHYPHNWRWLWPPFYAGVTGYRRSGGARQRDDVPDALTGMIEKREPMNRTRYART